MSEAESRKPEAYEIEPDEDSPRPEPAARGKSVHDLDNCPNCGSAMPGSNSLVCLRCGYDLKTMRVVQTKTTATVADEEEEAEIPALARAGGPSWLPTALLATGLLILAVATLAGWRGLFPAVAPEEAITFPARLLALCRIPVMLGLWTACSMAGLLTLAWLSGRPFGDVPLALGRAAGIAAIGLVVTLVRLQWRFGEIAAEAVLATGVFFALTLVLFRTTPRDAGKAAAFSLLAFVALTVVAQLVVWAA